MPASHVPVVALTVSPNIVVPLIVGVGVAARSPMATAAVAADSLVTLVNPVLLPVTLTVMALPTSPATGVYADAVAPAMSVPPAVHW